MLTVWSGRNEKEVIPINNTRKNIARAKAIEQENRKRLLKLNPELNDHGGKKCRLFIGTVGILLKNRNNQIA